MTEDIEETTQTHPAHRSPVLTALRVFSVLTALGAVVQGVLGIGLISGARGWMDTHGTSGMVTMVLAVIAAICAIVWKRQSGNTGLMMHALTVAVLGIVQFGLGEAHLQLVHIIVGVIFLVAAIALATLSLRPGGFSRRGRRKA